MKVVALVSGGKDSCYAMMKCLQYGHEIVALANLMPVDDAEDELDSYMYQTVGHQIVVSYAKCMGVPLFRRRIQGSTRHYDLSYHVTPGDEVEDMFILLNEVKRKIPSVTAVSSGAIASDYQRLRVESVCSRLGLVSLAYLWKQDQSSLLQEMIESGIVAIIVKVAAIGLDPSRHLGKEISFLQPHLHKIKELYGINVCGEGGEYETLTLDCPLFKNARIVLDEFQVILHSSDSIAPVGVLHPLAFHLETKTVTGGSEIDVIRPGKLDAVYEVADNSHGKCEEMSKAVDINSSVAEAAEEELHISRAKKDNTFSISCWLRDLCTDSSDLQKDLELVLTKIEKQLVKHCYSWENVLYIHLYISDMNKFATANDTYIRYITQEKCKFGVPSRSTIELPLSQVGLGKAYIEVLVANDHVKRVLHVQSISSWAPSCIGPYSQATLHKDILYMAGQLGLEPPTMLLCSGGAIAELERALENSEAVAKAFNCSISTSAVLFIIYCSTSISDSERTAVEEKKDSILKQLRLLHMDGRSKCSVLDPIFLYVFVPDLPKRALVEIKPVLYVERDMVDGTDDAIEGLSTSLDYWGFQHENWHDSCMQKCVIHGKICAAILSVSKVVAANICSDVKTNGALGDMECETTISEEQMGRIARFCIFTLDKFLLQNHFSWNDILSLRFYFPINIQINHKTLSLIFSTAFDEFARMSQRFKISSEPIFNIVPVLSVGRNPSLLDDILTCELLSSKL